MKALFRKLEKWLAPCWAIVILVLSIMPTSDMSIHSDMLFPHADKVVHFTMYFILQVFSMSNNLLASKRRNDIFIFSLVAAYGVLMELIQGYFLVDRFFDYYDIIANITGALMGNLFFNRIKS